VADAEGVEALRRRPRLARKVGQGRILPPQDAEAPDVVAEADAVGQQRQPLLVRQKAL
jgi:hypothetical protein